MAEIIAGFVKTPTTQDGFSARGAVREVGEALAGKVADTAFIHVVVVGKDTSHKVYVWRRHGLFPSEHPTPPNGPDGDGGQPLPEDLAA